MKTKVARFIVLLSLCACESIAPIEHNGSECFNLENCDIGFICIGATPNSAGLCLRPSEPVCGDGLVRQGLTLGESGYESCDDGNLSNTDGCSNGCVSARCGDGFIRNDLDPEVAGFDSPYENCEDGNLVDDDACTNLCQRARCGDGVLRSSLQAGDSGFEACDDGNLVGGDACTSLCMPARCGDGFVQNGVDECDDGNLEDRDACTNTCTLARCGDGVARMDIAEGEPGFEVCDDGNDDDLDSCSNACLGAACGDGVVQDGENCDDGNRQDDDACDNYCGVGIVQLLLGQTFSCALVANSDVYCWGSNESGELGLNDRISRGQATKLADLGSVVSLHGAQSRGVCALLENGDLNCWSLENGSAASNGDPLPQILPWIESVKGLALANRQACAVKRDGSVFCWDGLDLSAGENLAQMGGLSNIVQVIGRSQSFCALDINGAVYCWGDNAHGQLGDGSTEDHLDARIVEGLAPVSELFALPNAVCAQVRNQSLWCWGKQNVVPINLPGPHLRPIEIRTLNGVKSMGGYHDSSPWALLSNGSLWRWNHNDRTPKLRSLPNSPELLLFHNGFQHFCWVTQTQEAHCSGQNAAGQLGVGIPPYQLEPTTLALNIDSVAQFRSGEVSCAVASDNQVTCWGDHNRLDAGRRPEGALTYRVERKVGLSPVSQVSFSRDVICVRHVNGQLSCWGGYGRGLLGRGSDESSYEIGFVANIDSAEQVEVSTSHVCARLASEGVVCWGHNSDGRLGNGTLDSSNIPVPVRELTQVVDLAVSTGTTCALKRDGSVWCWGSDGGNGYQLGQGVRRDPSALPIQVQSIDSASVLRYSTGAFCVVQGLQFGNCWGSSQIWRREDEIRAILPESLLVLTGSYWHGAAIGLEGNLWTWGYSRVGNQGPLTQSAGDYILPHSIEGFELANDVQVYGDSTCILTQSGQIQCVGRFPDPAYYHLQDATRVVGLNGYQAPEAP